MSQSDRSVEDVAPEGSGRVADLERTIGYLESRLSAYERLFQENPIPFLAYSTDSLEILAANQSALTIYGYDSEQIARLKLSDLFLPNPHLNWEELAGELRKPFNSLGPFIHRGARNRELVVNMVLFAFELAGKNARVAMIRDDTARHTAEELLRASEGRYRELFENANDVIFLLDLNGKIIAINRAAESLTGYSRTEVLGKSFEELVAPDARDRTQDSIRAHLGGSATQHYELPIVSKLGTLRFLEVSARISYRRGNPVAIQGIGRDITERKQAQQRLLENARELQRKNEELSSALHLAREATQLKEQFLANTSHELRTPLNGIMGMTNLLMSTELTSDQREYAEAVGKCANDLLTIINDLLDMTQIEGGRLALAQAYFDVRESLRTVVKLLRLRAHAKQLTLTYEIDPLLPLRIYGDSVRFRQILTNLIANAVKFTQEGSVHVRMAFGQREADLRCEVIDSGIGVEDGVRDRIFDAFFQADGTTRRRFGGTGLGLAISKQLVEIMGGRISMFNNNPGPGSTFWFELPLQAPEADADNYETLASALPDLP